MGVPKGEAISVAFDAIAAARRTGLSRSTIESLIAKCARQPDAWKTDEIFGRLAMTIAASASARRSFIERKAPAPYRVWGSDFDSKALEQMENACRLPVSAIGALMPDAHPGYGLPIGGVLATRDAVIPYAVGMDIACRMKLTVLDLPPSTLDTASQRLREAIERETRFGVGAGFSKRHHHPVMDENWSVSPITARDKDKAWGQLGSSGSGNHFVEFGTLTLDKPDLGLPAGSHLALLSHSGSRGTGGDVATFYSHLAMKRHPELPRELQHLAWFELGQHEGQEYWLAMELMGHYAAANHELIHRAIARHLGATVLLDIENHHNFAWREVHFGEEVIVHRKGATPAGTGIIGVIPGSMATPGFVVRGKGDPESLNSASHGAGRCMSRTATKSTYSWSDATPVLKTAGVTLISAGLDEIPFAYKDILTVMEAQRGLVDIVARFDPKLVKMAPGGERPED